MPGATLTDHVDDVYHGKVKVKVGPVTAQYAGTAQFKERDEAAHHMVLEATGKESSGRGRASALVNVDLVAEGAQTRVKVVTDLTISGPLAQFGRGSDRRSVVEAARPVRDEPRVDGAGRRPTKPEAAGTETAGTPATSAPSASAAPSTATPPPPHHPTPQRRARPRPRRRRVDRLRTDRSRRLRPRRMRRRRADATASAPAATAGATSVAPAAARRDVVAPASSAAPATSTPSAAPPASAGATPAPSTRRAQPAQAPAAEVNLLKVAAWPILKRLIPVLVVVAVIVILIVWLVLDGDGNAMIHCGGHGRRCTGTNRPPQWIIA